MMVVMSKPLSTLWAYSHTNYKFGTKYSEMRQCSHGAGLYVQRVHGNLLRQDSGKPIRRNNIETVDLLNTWVE